MTPRDFWILLALGFASGTAFGYAVGWAICEIRERRRHERWQFLARRPWIEEERQRLYRNRFKL